MRLAISAVFGLNLLLSNFCLMSALGAQTMPAGHGSHEHSMTDGTISPVQHPQDCAGHCLLSGGSTAERAVSDTASLLTGLAVATVPSIAYSSLTDIDGYLVGDSAQTHPPNPIETVVLRC